MTTKKMSLISGLAIAAIVSIGASAQAAAPVVYKLAITNGSQMPISPGVIYSKVGEVPATEIGAPSSAGLIALCQAGNAAPREVEIKSEASTRFVLSTTGPILPGETKEIEVTVANPKTDSVHFEAMYGKTKDVCTSGSFGSHALVALQQHVSTVARAKDDVILTGAFFDPALPAGMTYLDASVCQSATEAISCLRSLAQPNPAPAKVRFFAGYLPSLITALETKYGAADTQTLLIPTAGAVRLSLQLKH